MKQYQVISECIDSAGERRYPGDVLELDEDQYTRAQLSGVVGSEITEDDNAFEGLIKLGGGYYELPNGEKVRGLDKAQKALQELKEGELNAQAETGNSSNGGTGDAEPDQNAAEN